MLGGIMYKTNNRSACETVKWDKPGKYELFDSIKQSLRMVSPDCDTKRSGPCKSLASSTNLKGK